MPIDDEDLELPAASDTPESEMIARTDKQSVQKALERLPVPFREMILLCDVEEMSYREIAETLTIPVGTVMSRLSRARTAMRQLLASEVREAAP